MHSALYLPKPSAQLLPPYLNPDDSPIFSFFMGIQPTFFTMVEEQERPTALLLAPDGFSPQP
jgi:hypothetical protein